MLEIGNPTLSAGFFLCARKIHAQDGHGTENSCAGRACYIMAFLRAAGVYNHVADPIKIIHLTRNGQVVLIICRHEIGHFL